MSEKRFPSDAYDKFMLRLPDGMRERIKESAERNHRSMNSEIVARLAESLDQTGIDGEPGQFDDAIRRLRQTLDALVALNKKPKS